jgi:hypothetical protein
LLTSIARRPASVMVNRNMLGVRPPAFTISGLGTASPARTILASSLTSNPCARNGEASERGGGTVFRASPTTPHLGRWLLAIMHWSK